MATLGLGRFGEAMALSKSKRTNFDTLDDKTISNILSYLPSLEVMKLRTVSRRWHKICTERCRCSTLTDRSVGPVFSAGAGHLPKPIDVLSVHSLSNPLTKDNFRHAERVSKLYFDFGDALISKGKANMIHTISEIHEDFFNDDIWNIRKSTISQKNIIWILENCTNTDSYIFNTGSMQSFEVPLRTKRFDNVKMNNIRHIVASVSPKDYKPLFKGLLTGKLPNLKVFVVQFKIPVNTFPLEICNAVFSFVFHVRGTLEILDIKHVPCATTNSTKPGQRQRSRPKHSGFKNRRIAGAQDLTPYQLRDLRLEMKKELNVERRLELDFLRSQSFLSKMTLIGVPIIDIVQAVRMNSQSLSVLNIRDIPGHSGPNEPGLFDCTCLENCKSLKVFTTADYIVKDIRKIPKSVIFISMHSGFPNDGPISEMSDVIHIADRYSDFGVCIHLPNLDHAEVQNYFRREGIRAEGQIGRRSQGFVIRTSKGERNHRVGVAKLSLLKSLLPSIPRRAYDWVIDELEELLNPPEEVRKAEEAKNRLKKAQLMPPPVQSKVEVTKARPVEPKAEVSVRKTCAQSMPIKAMSVQQKTQGIAHNSKAGFPAEALKLVMLTLKTKDRKSCRLVSKEWCEVVETTLNFGYWLNDRTSSWIQNSQVPLSFLAVSKLNRPLDPKRQNFAQNINVLVLECDEMSFRDDRRGRRPGNGLDNHFLSEESPSSSILEANIRFILLCGKNALCLFFNQWALSNFLSTLEKENEIMNTGDFPNLRILSSFLIGTLCSGHERYNESLAIQVWPLYLQIIVCGMEISHMANLMKVKFPKLNQLILKFKCISRAHTLDQFESIFGFIVDHKETIKRLELCNPPLPPDLRKGGRKGKLEIQATEVYRKVFNELENVQLDELIINMANNSLKWPLGLFLISVQRNLTKIRCTGINVLNLMNAISSSSRTLESIEINDFEPAGNLTKAKESSPHFNADCLGPCKILSDLNLHNFVGINGLIGKIPSSIRALTISIASMKRQDVFCMCLNLPSLKVLTLQENKSITNSSFSSYFDVKGKKKAGKDQTKPGKMERISAQINRAKSMTFVYGLLSQIDICVCQISQVPVEFSLHQRTTWYDENGNGFIPPTGRSCNCNVYSTDDFYF